MLQICVCWLLTTKIKGLQLNSRLFLTCCNPSVLDCKGRHKCNYFCHNNCSGKSSDKLLVLRKDVMLATCWHLQVAAAALCFIWCAPNNCLWSLFLFSIKTFWHCTILFLSLSFASSVALLNASTLPWSSSHTFGGSNRIVAEARVYYFQHETGVSIFP